MISIVLPAYNEAGAIAGTIEAIGRVPGLPEHEIVVVDDGSSDRTGEMAASAGARVIRHPSNAGYGRSLKDGIAAAAHDTIVILDADGTYPVDDIPRLLAEFDRGFDLVVGARSGVHYRGAWFKAPLRAVLTFLVEFTAGCRVADVNSGLRVFRRATVMPYFPQLCDTFSFTTSMTLAYLLTGRFVAHVPIGYKERVGTTKVRLLRDALRTLQYIVQGIVYYNPVKMFLLLAGACAAVVAAALMLLAVTQAPVAVVVAAAGALAAILVFGLGLVADLLRQILNR
jgi:glycosyltransferase involved in cell wall biosynthesis